METTLVFGASLKPNRYSNLVIHRLVGHGIKTEAFGLKSGIIGGVQVKTKIEDFQNIQTITLYLNPNNQKGYYDAIVGLRPRRVIFNPGTENPDFQKILEFQGIEVQVACTLVLLAAGQY
jgi:predicted CoA-binding protein